MRSFEQQPDYGLNAPLIELHTKHISDPVGFYNGLMERLRFDPIRDEHLARQQAVTDRLAAEAGNLDTADLPLNNSITI
jgi:hypothetical protein